MKYAIPTYYIIACSEASSNLAKFDGIHYGLSDFQKADFGKACKNSRSKGFGDEVKKRILIGTYALSSGYYDAYYNKACLVRRLIYNDFQQAFKVCDAILTPVNPSTAPPIGKVIENPRQHI